MRNSDPTIPLALAGAAPSTTEHRAKRIGGAPFIGKSYRRCKAQIAEALERAAREAGVSQRRLAAAAGVDLRLVQSWMDPEGSNGLRLDLALTAALDGGPECRDAVVKLLRSALEVLDGS